MAIYQGKGKCDEVKRHEDREVGIGERKRRRWMEKMRGTAFCLSCLSSFHFSLSFSLSLLGLVSPTPIIGVESQLHERLVSQSSRNCLPVWRRSLSLLDESTRV